MASTTFLAADFGASSGRLVAARFDGQRMDLEELHRFDNGPVWAGETMLWNWLGLWSELQDGLRIAARHCGSDIRSLGVDTWGVDFALLGRDGTVLANPVHYRDRRTDGTMDKAFQRVSKEEIFSETGLQFLPFNTLFQLLALRAASPEVIDAADSLLLIPDLFHWLLSGEKSNEQTNASTTQLYDPRTCRWSTHLIDRFELPPHLFGSIQPPGTRIGSLQRQVRSQIGLGEVDVIAPPTHDTASAVLAVPSGAGPAERPDWCFISSGTWSLMGVESTVPCLTDRCRDENFTNEAGVGNTSRILKNIAGMWPVQECRRIWANAGQEYSWSQLVQMAREAAPLVATFDPDDPRLTNPEDMPETILQLCRESGGGIPQSQGAIVRAVFESLALRYRDVLMTLEDLTGGPIRTIHIVGGGSQNELLSQMTADATGRQVVAGPVEATAIGNALQQAISTGHVNSIAEARMVVQASFELKTYEPKDTARWTEAR